MCIVVYKSEEIFYIKYHFNIFRSLCGTCLHQEVYYMQYDIMRLWEINKMMMQNTPCDGAFMMLFDKWLFLWCHMFDNLWRLLRASSWGNMQAPLMNWIRVIFSRVEYTWGTLTSDTKYSYNPGWQILRNRTTGGARKVRVFYERKNPNIRYFVAKLSIVAIYAPIERPP